MTKKEAGGASDKDAATTADRLRSIIERVERLEEEKTGLQNDIKDIMSGAKSDGFDVKAIRKIISLRKKDEHVRNEEEEILSTYMAALGMLPDFDE